MTLPQEIGEDFRVMGRQNGVGSSAGHGRAGCETSRAMVRRGVFHGGGLLWAGAIFALGASDSFAADPLPTPFEIYVDPLVLRSGLGATALEANVRLRGVPADGLYSYGIRLAYSADLLRIDGASSIEVPSFLDHNGPVDGGALRLSGDGFAAVKGTIDIQSPSLQPYTGELLATFRLVPVNPLKTGTSPLELSVFRTLGDSESIFVTGTGGVLDGNLTLTGGQVVITPEPGTSALLGLGIALGGSACWIMRSTRSGSPVT